MMFLHKSIDLYELWGFFYTSVGGLSFVEAVDAENVKSSRNGKTSAGFYFLKSMPWMVVGMKRRKICLLTTPALAVFCLGPIC